MCHYFHRGTETVTVFPEETFTDADCPRDGGHSGGEAHGAMVPRDVTRDMTL
jgi:hypothetical protein